MINKQEELDITMKKETTRRLLIFVLAVVSLAAALLLNKYAGGCAVKGCDDERVYQSRWCEFHNRPDEQRKIQRAYMFHEEYIDRRTPEEKSREIAESTRIREETTEATHSTEETKRVTIIPYSPPDNYPSYTPRSGSGRNSLNNDPDDYDNPDDYADDAWGEDFDDWDDAYDYWEDY
ncbi:MAG: hypothetical protein Q4D60_10870 [Eubacteriales bacterium]|nr:hypothetical protein [Eubacteriales bacterium]